MQPTNKNIALVMQPATYQYLKEMPAFAIIYFNHKKRVRKSEFPETSLLYSQQSCDYCESYVITHKDPFGKIVPDDLLHAFEWGRAACLLPIPQRRMVTVWQHFPFTCEKRRRTHQIVYKSEQEIVVEKAGKHLVTRRSLLIQRTRKNASQITIVLSTSIQAHTAMGKLYISIRRSFLKFVTPLLLKRLVTHL